MVTGGVLSTNVKGLGKVFGDAPGVAHLLGGGGGGDDAASYLYRGVHKGHPAEVPARDGIVVPGNPYDNTITPEAHNLGGVSADSSLTSWTRREDVARGYVGPDGVVLRVRTGAPPPGAGWSWHWSPDKYEESEVLMKGIREDAEVLP
jgi:hypothetical protein